MAFLDDNYLIGNATGKRIFNEVKDLPVIDPHNHANVREIADNQCYSDAWQLFAATDHYVWEMLRKRGVPESLITGREASAEEKFLAMAKVFPEIVGNPVYEWIHLDLKRYFGIDELLSEKSGKKIWNAVNEKLATDAFRPQALLTGPHAEGTPAPIPYAVERRVPFEQSVPAEGVHGEDRVRVFGFCRNVQATVAEEAGGGDVLFDITYHEISCAQDAYIPFNEFFVMLFRPQGLLGMKELSFVKTWDSLVAFVQQKRALRKGKGSVEKSAVKKEKTDE